MRELFTFDDVLIVPQFSSITSRKDVHVGVQTSKKVFRGVHASLPIVSANMDTVTGVEMARAMLRAGGQACLHRFQSLEDNVKMLNAAETPITDDPDEDIFMRPWVSLGLGKEELDRAYALYGNNATVFVIDVAHGAQMAVVEQAKALRKLIRENGAILVGNFASARSVLDFHENVGYGTIDGFKIGIGPGSACTTRTKTGVGYPQLSAVQDIAHEFKNSGMALIADGGMRTPGDVAKALGAGAHMVMLGGMFAGTDETPGDRMFEVWDSFLGQETFVHEETLRHSPPRYDIKKSFKKYRGSASKESYELQGKTGTHRTAEGESFQVPCKGPVADVLQDIEGGLRSAMTYVGAKNLTEFREKVEFVRVSPATVKENGAHGK